MFSLMRWAWIPSDIRRFEVNECSKFRVRENDLFTHSPAVPRCVFTNVFPLILTVALAYGCSQVVSLPLLNSEPLNTQNFGMSLFFPTIPKPLKQHPI